MLTMNLGTLHGDALVWVYGGALALGWSLVRRIDLDPDSSWSWKPADRWWVDIGFALVVGGIALTRTGYFSEAWMGHVIEPVCWDDWFHLQDISSVVNSERFPPTSAMRPDRFLSIYYGPWMLVGFLYRLVPLWWFTLKNALCVGIAIHVLLTGYLGVILARRCSQRRSQFFTLVYLIFLYAGAESVFVFVDPGLQLEWWTRRFGLDVHVPSWPQQMLWVMHHLSATVSAVLAAWVFTVPERSAKRQTDWRVWVVVGLLLTHALYSSVFVVLGALPIGLAFVAWRVRTRWRELLAVSAVTVPTALSMLWIYLRKDTHFVIGKHIKHLNEPMFGIPEPAWDIVVSMGRYVGLISLDLIGYGGLLLLGFRGWARDRHHRVLVVLAVLFILSTGWMSFSGIDNYTARGVMVPLLVLAWVASRHAPGATVGNPIVLAVLAFLALGTVNDLYIFHARNIKHIRSPVLSARMQARMDRRIYGVNAARDFRSVDFDVLFEGQMPQELQVWQVEKVLTGSHRPSEMQGWERTRELSEERTNPGPYGPWAWQNWREQIADKHP